MAVAYVAYQTLSPQVRQEVTRLVRLNPSCGAWTANVPIADRDLHAFMLAATWPDQIKSDGQHVSDGPCNGNRPPDGPEAGQNVSYSDNRMHKYWHFKDVPFSRDHTPLQPPPPINIQERIELFLKALSGPKPASMSAADFDLMKSYD